MTKRGHHEHEHALEIWRRAYESQGARVIILHRRVPDAIVAWLEDGKIKLEALDPMNFGRKYRSPSDRNYLANAKKKDYEALGFDKVTIVPFSKFDKQ